MATVANGVVTPLTAGTTTITVTTVDGGLTATCAVTVNPAVLAVGDSYDGGIIAYILQSGDYGYISGQTHGLIAATEDQSTGIAWSNIISTWIRNTGTAIGTGQANTTAIIAQAGHSSSAAKICADYTVAVNSVTYDDWYLPSRDELYKLSINIVAIGGFAAGYYWSSSESNNLHAWNVTFLSGSFDNGNQNISGKGVTRLVRAVRAF